MIFRLCLPSFNLEPTATVNVESSASCRMIRRGMLTTVAASAGLNDQALLRNLDAQRPIMALMFNCAYKIPGFFAVC